jgi:hypothetical protein
MSLTTQDVWDAIGDSIFGVLGFVNQGCEPRTAGVCFVTDGRSLLMTSGADSWKVRHIARNPNVSMTITVPKRIPFLPFIKIPAATITFKGDAEILAMTEVDNSVATRLFRGLEPDRKVVEETRIIRLVPRGDFVTYGIAMPTMRMRKPSEATGRAPCGTEQPRPLVTR